MVGGGEYGFRLGWVSWSRLELEGGGVYSFHVWSPSPSDYYSDIPSHSYNAGTEHVGFSPTRRRGGRNI